MKKIGRYVARLFTSRDGMVVQQGSLIPRGSTYPTHTFTPQNAKGGMSLGVRVVGVAVVLFMLGVVGVTGYAVTSQANLASVLTVTIVDPHTDVTAELSYGPQPALSATGFFVETRNAFIEEQLTFIEIDIDEQQLRFFKDGVLVQHAAVVSVGASDSWWSTPSGLYQIEQKNEQFFSSVGQVYLPWQLSFQGNFMIHGQPTNGVAQPVSSNGVVGGVRLDDEDAARLFAQAVVGTPVLVHATAGNDDRFVYRPQVEGITAQQYFAADIGNGAVLAGTDPDDPAPVASLTKLMTAVVAAEHIDLDGRVQVASPTFVTSLIPRLAERSSVSMYSLLQLLLVESSNEAAETIAGEFGRDAFIAEMNAKARQLGMMQTHFADPSGLSADNVSTLGDLYRLTKYIYDNRGFIFEITATAGLSSAQSGGEFDGLINFNEVKDMDNFVGGKVGETIAAGKTSISLHRIIVQGEERTIAVILLNADERTGDITALISYVTQQYSQE